MFPALTVESPGATVSGLSCETASQIPRTLNDPVGSRVSAFSSSRSPSAGPAGTSGLAGNTRRSRSAAASASDQRGGWIVTAGFLLPPGCLHPHREARKGWP